MITESKKRYHPLIIILFSSGMLSTDELNNIARTTKYNWRNFKHEDYYGHEWTKRYIEQFDDIKDIFKSKFTARAIKIILKARHGYYAMLNELTHHKNLMKLHVNSILTSVKDMAQFSGVTVKKACKFYGISKDWYYAQKQKLTCHLSPLKKCYKTHTNQLTVKEVIAIEHLVKIPENAKKPLSTIYFDAMSKHSVTCGLTTFRKYANALGFVKLHPERSKQKKGFVSSYVFEWLHIDITNVQTERDGMQKVAFIKDNFSSGLLNAKSTSRKAGSAFIAELLQETFEKYKLYDYKKDIHILSDGGSENKGEVLSWVKNIKAPPIVKKLTAMSSDFPFSNAMSEITHSIYKSEFMGGKISEDIASHLKSLEAFMTYYNYHRYPCRLYGKTPMQIVNGEAINRNLYTQRIKEAKTARVETNRKFNACVSKLGCGVF